MPGVRSCPMCRPMSPLRPITADGRARGYIGRAPDRQRACLFTAIALIAILPTINCENIAIERISRGAVQSNSSVENPSNSTNEIELSDNDDDDFYLGYSGYLRSSSSMLHLRSDYHNFDGNSVPPRPSNDTAPQDSKALGHRRLKRAVTHLYNMIICATGCNPLAYKGYGCYCGFLGSGYPMDGIDRCCKMHDWCYDASDCPMFVEYFVPYYWKCYRGYKPICAIDHGEWGSSGSCAQRLCECDRSFAECLRRYRCPRHKAVCTSSPWRLIQNLFMIV